jgi:monovalent cation/proton antiporter MnhG/PhaG subunit
MRDVAVAVLLGAGVAVELASVLGMLLLRDAFDRLHFTAPATTLGPLAIAAAVVLRESFSQAGIKALLVAVVLLVTNPVLTHATARAARIRAHGAWTVQEGEEVTEP